MHSESEIKDDLDKLRAFIDALKDKYGDDFSCVFSTGVATEEYWIGGCLACGDDYMLHQACHGLLENVRFIDQFFDAVKCLISKGGNDRPEFLKELMRDSLDSLKKIIIRNSDGFKKHLEELDTENAIKNLLKESGFTN